MSGYPHPSRPGESAVQTARVRHRLSGRFGRLAGVADGSGPTIAVLFDGDAEPKRVLPSCLVYLDDAEASPDRGRG